MTTSQGERTQATQTYEEQTLCRTDFIQNPQESTLNYISTRKLLCNLLS
jgi:hypothetical protein